MDMGPPEHSPTEPLNATLEAREWNVFLLGLEHLTAMLAGKLVMQLNQQQGGQSRSRVAAFQDVAPPS